jgi:amino acid transporter
MAIDIASRVSRRKIPQRCTRSVRTYPQMPTKTDDTATETGLQGHALTRQLTLRDLVLTQILCVVGSAWVGVAAGLGRAQALVWIAAMALFYLPMAVSVYYLNREMPLEGGLYVWARRAFGDAWGFMTAWNIWAYGLCVAAAILFGIPTELAYLLGPSFAWLPEDHVVALSILGVLLAALTLASLRGLAIGRWIHNISGAGMVTVFALLVLTPFWAMLHGTPLHYAPLAIALPKANLYSLALMGQMFGALCGLEYIAILAGEAKAPTRNIGLSVVISSPIICAMFILGTGAVLAFHEFHANTKIDFIAPIPQTLRFAFGNTGFGNVVAMAAIVLVQLRLLGATSYIFTGVTRLPMTAGWDHLIPAWFARLSKRNQVPTNSILVSAGIVAALLVLGSTGVKTAEAFQVLTQASIELYALSYLAMFAIPLVGAATLRSRFPAWVSWTSIAGFAFTCFAFLLTAYPFVEVVNAKAYAAKILGTTLLANIVGLTFYLIRRKPAK